MRVLEDPVQPRELPLVLFHRLFNALYPLVHGVELVSGHDVAGNLLVAALGAQR